MFKLKIREHHQKDIDPRFHLKNRAERSLPLKQENTWRAQNVLNKLHRTHNNSNPKKTRRKRPGDKGGTFMKSRNKSNLNIFLTNETTKDPFPYSKLLPIEYQRVFEAIERGS